MGQIFNEHAVVFMALVFLVGFVVFEMSGTNHPAGGKTDLRRVADYFPFNGKEKEHRNFKSLFQAPPALARTRTGPRDQGGGASPGRRASASLSSGGSDASMARLECSSHQH